MMRKWSLLVCSMLFMVAAVAAENDVRPYIFNGQAFFSDRPLLVSDDRLVYQDTREDFVVGNGQKINATYVTSNGNTAPLCVNCRNESNTPARLLKPTIKAEIIPASKIEVLESRTILTIPTSKIETSTQNTLTVTAREASWGGIKVQMIGGQAVVFNAAGQYWNRSDEKEPYTTSMSSPRANGMCHQSTTYIIGSPRANGMCHQSTTYIIGSPCANGMCHKQ